MFKKKKSWKWVMTRLWRVRMRFVENNKSQFKFSNPLIHKLTEKLNKKNV